MDTQSHTSREYMAFVLSPLVVPVVVAFSLPGGSQQIALTFATIVSYAGTILFGVPAYLFLKSRHWTSVWIAAGLGLLLGMIVWLAADVLIAFLLESPVLAALTDPAWQSGTIWPGGISGMLVGIILWLIARPDRAIQSY